MKAKDVEGKLLQSEQLNLIFIDNKQCHSELGKINSGQRSSQGVLSSRNI